MIKDDFMSTFPNIDSDLTPLSALTVVFFRLKAEPEQNIVSDATRNASCQSHLATMFRCVTVVNIFQ